MALKESLKSLNSLAEALPAILELAGPLEKMESLESLELKIRGSEHELLKLEDAIVVSKQELLSARATAESATKAATELAQTISDRAFEESRPRRLAIEVEMKNLESALRDMKAAHDRTTEAVDSREQELEDLKEKIAAVKDRKSVV